MVNNNFEITLRTQIIVFIIFLMFGSLESFGQAKKDSIIRIHQSKSVEKIVKKHQEVCKVYPKSKGYRVQIFSVSGANSRDRVELLKAEFLSKFPDADINIVYHAPSYKIRIGNFRSKLEALNYLESIKSIYPFAFVVIDKIDFK